MKAIWVMPVVATLFLAYSYSFAGDTDSDCLNSPQQLTWGNGGSTKVKLCGYQNGDVNTSYIQITDIPRKTKNGCLTIEYEPASDKFLTNDSLTVAPNEGVVVGESRSPTTLAIDNTDGTQTTSLPVKTDNVNHNKYGVSVSGQSSSVDVNVKINWQHDPSCGS
jgi:hypothetical protein